MDKKITYQNLDFGQKGLTLVEVVAVVALTSVFFLAISGAFYAFSRAVQYTKTRILANTLAAEKIEMLKNLSYYRLMVTKEIDLNETEPDYDRTYYPPESLTVGGIDFTRYTVVYRVYEDTNGRIIRVTNPDDSSDTDLKLIKVYVTWYQGADIKTVELENLRENPDRVPLGGKIYGYITSTGTIVWGGTTQGYNNSSDPPPADRVRLGSARIYVYENPAYEYYTDTTGKYEIKLPTGTWKLVVSKSGYWEYTTPSINVPKSAAGVIANVQLMQKLTGIVTGYVVYNDHLVISQIVASTVSPTGFDQEYIELYNPTTWQWVITDTTFDLKIHTQNPGKRPDVYLYDVPLNFVNTSIQPNGGYYLIANTPTVIVAGNMITADAYYAGPYYGKDLIEAKKAGAVVIADDYGVAIDSVGWSNGVTAPAAGWYETNYAANNYIYLAEGFKPGYTLMRAAYVGGNSPTVSYNDGNAWDMNSNKYDFYFPPVTTGYMLLSSAILPRNSSVVVRPRSGTPAYGAIVSADDGLSTPVTVSPPGYGPPYFEITLATGTWTVMISSGMFFMQITSVTVLAGQRTGIPNNKTTPSWTPWPPTTDPQVFLSSITTYGYVTGNIGVNVSGIKVTSPEEPNPTYTNSSGRYILPILLSGTDYIETYVTANPYPDTANNPQYTTEMSSVSVYLGQISILNFRLSQAGKIIGMVTTSAVNPAGNPLPGVVVKATKGPIVKTSVSESDGKFTFLNLSTGTWTVEPVLDAGESSTPSSVTSTLSVGQTLFIATFVVSGAYGLFTGEVREGGSSGPLVKTGVLILATTTTINVSNPPEINMTNPPSIPYYFTVSDGKGQYKLYVRGGYKYNIYAWMTKVARYQIVVTPLNAYTDQLISAGSVVNRNIIFP